MSNRRIFKIPIFDLNAMKIQIAQSPAMKGPDGKTFKVKGQELSPRTMITCPEHQAAGVHLVYVEDEPGILLFCNECKEPFGGIPMEEDSEQKAVKVTGTMPFTLFGDSADEIEKAVQSGPEELYKYVGSKILEQMKAATEDVLIDKDTPESVKTLLKSMLLNKDTIAAGISEIKKREKEEPKPKHRWSGDDTGSN